MAGGIVIVIMIVLGIFALLSGRDGGRDEPYTERDWRIKEEEEEAEDDEFFEDMLILDMLDEDDDDDDDD